MRGTINPAKCFLPRHGIRATHQGKIVKLVICFQCRRLLVYDSAGKTTQGLVGRSPEGLFDKVLAEAKIPKAK